MRGTQRNGRAGKQHWNQVYRRYITMKRVNEIMKKYLMPGIIRDIYEERPLTMHVRRISREQAIKEYT